MNKIITIATVAALSLAMAFSYCKADGTIKAEGVEPNVEVEIEEVEVGSVEYFANAWENGTDYNVEHDLGVEVIVYHAYNR